MSDPPKCEIHSAIFKPSTSHQVYDARMLRELATFKGHAKDVTAAAWHPFHEDLFVSGSFDGCLCYWLVSHPDGPKVAALIIALNPAVLYPFIFKEEIAFEGGASGCLRCMQ